MHSRKRPKPYALSTGTIKERQPETDTELFNHTLTRIY